MVRGDEPSAVQIGSAVSFGLQNQSIHRTPAGRIDSRFLNGADGSDIVQSWTLTSFPDLTQLLIGGSFSIDLADYLSDPGSPNCEIGMLPVSGDDPRAAGFTISGTTFSNSLTTARIGRFYITSLRNGVQVLAGPFNFAIRAPAGSDNVAPTVPTGITAAQGTDVGTIALAFDPPADIAPGSTPASGTTRVDVYVNGVLASPPSPVTTMANAMAAPTTVNIGSISSPDLPVYSQSGKLWTLSAAGTGIHATATEQCLFVDFGSLTGAHKFVAKLDPYTSSATTGLLGIMLHETAAAGGKFIFWGLRPSNGTTGIVLETRSTSSGTSAQALLQATDQNGAAIVGPVYVKLERAADNKTVTVSYSLNENNWIDVSTQSITMNAAVHYGLCATSQSAGTDLVGVIEEVALTNTPRLTAAVTSAVQVSLQLRSVDVGGNASGLSTSIIGIPKPPITQNTTIGWHPGHYGASGGTAGPGSTIASFTPEMDDMMKDDWINGYRLLISPSAMDIGPVTFTASVGGGVSGTLTASFLTSKFLAGVYTFRFSDGSYRDVTVAASGTSCTWSAPLATGSITTADVYYFGLIDQIIARCATHYNKPKYFWMTLQWMSFGGKKGAHGDISFVPAYILNDPGTYGPCPLSTGEGGWWGFTSGTTASTGVYTAKMYYAPVMNRNILLTQALGFRYNGIDTFDGLMFQENSAVTGDALAFQTAGSPNLNDPQYSDSAFGTQQRAWMNAAVAAFPNTNVGIQDTFMQTSTPTQQLAVDMMNSRVALCSSDTQGHNYIVAQGGVLGGWGAQAMQGVKAAGSTVTGLTDRRGHVACMYDVEGGNIGTVSGFKQSATPQDLCNGLNLDIKAQYAFWCHVPNSTPFEPAGAVLPTWSDITGVLKTNPLTNLAYPGNYQ